METGCKGHLAFPFSLFLSFPFSTGIKEEEGKDLISSANLCTLDSSDVASLLVEQLKEDKLTLLSEKKLAEALVKFVDKEDEEAVSE